MAEFFIDYGLFLAKAATVVVAVAVITAIIVGATRKAPSKEGLSVEKLNDKYRKMRQRLQESALSKAEWKKQAKTDKKAAKSREKSDAGDRKRLFIVDFKGDIRATGVAELREEVTAVVSVATDRDEVVVRLENAGGAVHEHGLAASQLLRITERGIPLTVIIDKVAASGGYLMACIANRVIAAPFAVIGSIGVIAQIPNFNRALQSKGVDFEMVTAGRYKRTVTMFGKNTDEDRAKLGEELEEVHSLFKRLVGEHRPSLDIEAIATGEHWYGSRALELGLIDELGCSDDYLLKSAEGADLYHVTYRSKHPLPERFLAAIDAAAGRAAERLAELRGRTLIR